MSFKRHQDKVGKRAAQTINAFRGIHNGYGRTDQPKEFSYSIDFDFLNEKPELRNGCRRNERWGFTGSVASMFPIRMNAMNLIGVIAQGTLSIFITKDVVGDGARRYYTWDEVGGFTWDEADSYTWEELQSGKTRT